MPIFDRYIKRFVAVIAIIVVVLFSGCSSQKSILDASPNLFLTYTMYPYPENLVPIEKEYRAMVKKMPKDAVYKQGECVEYAIALAVQERYKEAFKWFYKEATDYPISTEYVETLKKELIPIAVLQPLERELAEKLEKERVKAEKKAEKENRKLEKEQKKDKKKEKKEKADKQSKANKKDKDSSKDKSKRKLKDNEQNKAKIASLTDEQKSAIKEDKPNTKKKNNKKKKAEKNDAETSSETTN